MRIWPFSMRRRRANTSEKSWPAQKEPSDNVPQKQQQQQHRAQPPTAQPARRNTLRKNRISQQKMYYETEKIEDKDAIAPVVDADTSAPHETPDNTATVTALPVKYELGDSPHLRPVDHDREKAQIPYNFDHPTSHTSLPPADTAEPKTGTLRSKRSTFDGSTSIKKKLSKKRKEELVREEEIRAMSVTTVPSASKRAGDGPGRRDSFKRRTMIGNKASAASLGAPSSSVKSSTPTIVEQNGWEIKEFWVNPRPPIRLSKAPAYTWDNASQPQLPLARKISQKVKEKALQQKDSKSRHRTVGAAADELDSSDLRMLLERDSKRRQERERRKQERIDRRLRAAGRARGDSDVSRRGRNIDKAIEAGSGHASPAVPSAPTAIHPAFRDEPATPTEGATGLGIAPTVAANTTRHVDKQESPVIPTPDLQAPESQGGYDTPRDIDAEGPFEDPVIETAREVRLSIATTPPLSPVDRNKRASARMSSEPLSPASPAYVSPPQTPLPTDASPVVPAAVDSAVKSQGTIKRKGSEGRERRSGAWAAFFRRGTQKEPKATETSFANTSRESMSRHALPSHLETARESPFPKRSKSGPPTRTQSKFREDLPDAPISPPESRVQSPISDMPINAAAIASAAAAGHQAVTTSSPAHDNAALSPTAVLSSGANRSDTPVNPVRSSGVMSTSLASVDSEASWLASGGSLKRASAQSGLSKGLGSFQRRTPDFNASFEDLSTTGDKDAEYVQRTAEERRSAQLSRLSDQAVAGAPQETPDEEKRLAEDGNGLEVHGSVRRKPTLVHRDPSVRSREGLLSEYAAGESAAVESAVDDDVSPEDSEYDEQATQLQSARSVNYGSKHARHVSAGSAKLLEVHSSRRASGTPIVSPTTAAPPAEATK